MGDALVRTTAVAEASPRFAILGTSTYTDTEVGVRAKTSGASDDKYAFAIGRWTDSSNYAFAKLHLSAGTDTIYLGVRVAGVETILGEAPITIAPDTYYGVRLIAFASGLVMAAALGDAGATLAEASGTHAALATGGALASGKAGFADQSTGTAAATRTYDSFYAATPAPEPIVIYPGRSLELSTQAEMRESSDGTSWGRVPSYNGSHFKLSAAGAAGRVTRIVVAARRFDSETAEDAGVTDRTAVQVSYRAKFLVPR